MNALIKKTWSEAEVDTICGVQAVLDIKVVETVRQLFPEAVIKFPY